MKLYLKIFLILLLFFFFLYLTNCYTKRENFEQNNNTEKNINNIEVPANFIPAKHWTNTKSGINLLDNPQEHYLYEHDEKNKKYDKNSSQFTSSFTCRPSITGVFTDCGPYSFNACGPINPSTSLYNESKYRKHSNYNLNKNDKNKNDKNKNDKNKNDRNKDDRNKDELNYDEYINNLDGY